MAETMEARTLTGADVGRRIDARGLHGVIASICHASGVVDVEVSVGTRYPTAGMTFLPTDLVTVREAADEVRQGTGLYRCRLCAREYDVLEGRIGKFNYCFPDDTTQQNCYLLTI